jgi:hypothetical protein
MPTQLDIHLDNDTTSCKALRKSCTPACSQWNPAPPDVLPHGDDKRAVVSVNAGFNSAGLTYECHTDKGTVTLRLEINEGKLDKPIAFSSDPSIVSAKVTAHKMQPPGDWYYELQWTNGSGA